MHVGLNLVYLQEDSGGTGTYARELLRAFAAASPQTRLTAWVSAKDAPAWVHDEVECIPVPVRGSGSPVHVGVELGLLGLDARRRGMDVVHGLAYCAPVIAPGVATVVTLHDVIWRTRPESVTWLTRRMFGLLTPLSGTLCDRVITGTRASRRQLVDDLGLDAAKVVVVAHGAREPGPATPPDDVRRRLGIASAAEILLSVGQTTRHKNLATLIRALEHVQRPGVVLVAPGRPTGHSAELVAEAHHLGVADRVVLPGFVDDRDLESLYAQARAFVLPSLEEGFGLPVLEAMARGVPVACSAGGAPAEVAGGAALLFDPLDARGMAEAIDRLLGEPALREHLVARGRVRAAEHSWARAARDTLAVYEQALASRVVGRG